MGAFNMLTAEASCPNCGHQVVFEVQFKYGDTWQHRYLLGEKIKWGGNDIGRPGYRRVRVEAIGGPCSHCGFDNLEFDIILDEDRITTLMPIGVKRENESREGYAVEQVA